MAIQTPSQYQCDNLSEGDKIYIRSRNKLYRLYRYLFTHKPKLKIKISEDKYGYYYQEDCTILSTYELNCTQTMENEVPCMISYTNNPYCKKFMLKKLQVSLYNIQLTLPNNKIITFPLSSVQNCINRNDIVIKNIDNNKLIQDNIKFCKYKGDYFKNYIQQNNITKWTASYCSVCGHTVDFIFKDEDIDIQNNCVCNNMDLNLTHMTYDEFAIWYASQTNTYTKKYFDKFWFKRSKTNE